MVLCVFVRRSAYLSEVCLKCDVVVEGPVESQQACQGFNHGTPIPFSNFCRIFSNLVPQVYIFLMTAGLVFHVDSLLRDFFPVHIKLHC